MNWSKLKWKCWNCSGKDAILRIFMKLPLPPIWTSQIAKFFLQSARACVHGTFYYDELTTNYQSIGQQVRRAVWYLVYYFTLFYFLAQSRSSIFSPNGKYTTWLVLHFSGATYWGSRNHKIHLSSDEMEKIHKYCTVPFPQCGKCCFHLSLLFLLSLLSVSSSSITNYKLCGVCTEENDEVIGVRM